MNTHLTQRAADLLLVAGDLDSFNQIRHALQRAKVRNSLHHVGDAIEAKAYLRHEGPYLHAPVPGVVLLDAGLPKGSIIDLITEIKTNPQFAGIAVIAIAATDAEQELINNCVLQVDGRIGRPFSMREIVQVLLTIDTLSFLLVQGPPARS